MVLQDVSELKMCPRSEKVESYGSKPHPRLSHLCTLLNKFFSLFQVSTIYFLIEEHLIAPIRFIPEEPFEDYWMNQSPLGSFQSTDPIILDLVPLSITNRLWLIHCQYRSWVFIVDRDPCQFGSVSASSSLYSLSLQLLLKYIKRSFLIHALATGQLSSPLYRLIRKTSLYSWVVKVFRQRWQDFISDQILWAKHIWFMFFHFFPCRFFLNCSRTP